MMQAAAAKSSLLHLQSREAGYSKAGKCGFRAALRAEGCRSGVHKEPLAAAISGSLCDSSRGEGAGRRGQRRSRGGWRGGAAGGARWAAGAAAKRGRASCAPARGPAVASGPSPGPATGAGKGLSETSGLMRGPKCCLGGGCAREDARGARPSLLPARWGRLAWRPRLHGSGSLEAQLQALCCPSPLGRAGSPRQGVSSRSRGYSAELRGSLSRSRSRCVAWAGAARPKRRQG